MSEQTKKDIKMLMSRGVAESDPRVQGLKRRLEREAQVENDAARTTESVVAGVREAMKNA